MNLADAYLNRERCCDEDFGGSHYHCSQCNAVTGMMGHWVRASNQRSADMLRVPLGFEGFTCQVEGR